MPDVPFPVPIADLAALAWFLLLWIGYTWIADSVAWGRRPMARVMDDYRLRWFERMLERDNRMADVNIINAYIRSGTLFVSVTMLILAAAVALLGRIDSLRALVSELEFAHAATRQLMEIRILVLLAVFAYAFFKFMWCLRQFNYAMVLVGAAPQPSDCDATIRKRYPESIARLISRAVGNFNRGTRAYYFSLALLTWFLHPLALALSTVWVVLVLYRRDFRSVTLTTLTALGRDEDGMAGPPGAGRPPRWRG